MNKRAVALAAGTAAALMLIFGGGYRILAEYLARPGESIPMPRGTLARGLPMGIGEWAGTERPVEERIIKAADCDDYVSRTYRRQGETVELWLAYGVRARDLMPHRPEVCYPGNGWTLEDSRSASLPLPDGTKLECRIYEFSRGGLSSARMDVLNYYIVDGQYSPDVSLLRSKAWRGSGGVRYMVQVQIVASRGEGSTRQQDRDPVYTFALDAALPIRALMPATSEVEADGSAKDPGITGR